MAPLLPGTRPQHVETSPSAHPPLPFRVHNTMLGGGGRKGRGILVKETQIQRQSTHITRRTGEGGREGGREMDRSGEGVVVGSGGTEEEEENSTTSEKHNNQKTIIDTIMLKYRPIAPKPVGGGSPATSADSKNSVAGLAKRKRKYVRVANRRSTAAVPAGKDKVKDQKGKDPAPAMSAAPPDPDPDPPQQLGTTSKSVAEVRSGSNGSEQHKQLLYEFLPEISTHQKSAGISARNSTVSHDSSSSFPTDNSQILTTVVTAVAAEDDEARGSRSTSGGGDMGGSTGSISVLSDLSTAEMMKRKKQQRQGKEAVVVQSWVTVERLTDACMDTAVGAAGLGSTDFERKKNLEQDTCPGFISDALNQVPWTNLAYRKMVIGPRINDHRRDQLHHWLRLPVDQEEQEQEHHDDDDDDDDVVVLLVEKERLPIMYPAFACLVRLQYYNHMTCCTTMDRHKKDNKCCLTTMTVPCDVWRMDRGGFAWRLDVKAALTL